MPEAVLEKIRIIPWGKGMAGVAAASAQPVTTCNLQTATAGFIPEGARRTGLGGSLVVPMLLGDDVTGTLGVGTFAERRFRAAETDRLLELGAELARTLAPPATAVLDEALAGVEPAGRAWLDDVIRAAVAGDSAAVESAFPAAARRVGRGPLGSRGALVVGAHAIPLRAWRVDDAARVAMLLALPSGAEGLARRLYFAGDAREKASSLRALAVVGASPAALDAVLDASRLNQAEVFEAAIAENPYASAHLPAHEFRKAVLKCAFLGISLARVADLASRADRALTDMLLGYVSERELAARSVPPDVWPVAALHPVPGLAARLLGYLEHPSPAHRAAAARALGRLGDDATRPFLADRLGRETDEEVRRALEWAY
jgi:hypothetical protein